MLFLMKAGRGQGILHDKMTYLYKAIDFYYPVRLYLKLASAEAHREGNVGPYQTSSELNCRIWLNSSIPADLNKIMVFNI